MAARKQRPLLFELAKGASRKLGDPRVRPEQPRAIRSPASPERLEPQPVPVADEPPSIDIADSEGEETTLFSRRGITIAITATAVVVLLFVGIQARSYFQSDETPGLADGLLAQTLDRQPADSQTTLASDPQPRKRSSQSPTRSTASAKPVPQKKPTPPPAVPAVELQRGFSYVVVQHFPKSKSNAARAAAVFLRDKGIACAIWSDKDIQLIAIEPFDTGNADANVRKRETGRAATLMKNVREHGKTYFKTGRYDFNGCKLRRVK